MKEPRMDREAIWKRKLEYGAELHRREREKMKRENGAKERSLKRPNIKIPRTYRKIYICNKTVRPKILRWDFYFYHNTNKK